MSENKDEVVYTKPTSQIDLEQRLSEEAEAPVFNQSVNPSETKLDGDGFVGVDPIYQNAANETEEPLAAEDGADKLAEEAYEKAGERSDASEPLKESYDGVTPHKDSNPEEPASTEQPASTEAAGQSEEPSTEDNTADNQPQF